jgi:hypothetical protein
MSWLVAVCAEQQQQQQQNVAAYAACIPLDNALACEHAVTHAGITNMYPAPSSAALQRPRSDSSSG